MPKKAIIISLGNKPIQCIGVSEMSTDEFLRLQKESAENLKELLERYLQAERDIASLKNELDLDIQNGFHGKTVIHPSQIDVVNKAYVIKFEEWQDANNILNAKGGVFAGYKGNRMNEVNPHRSWAKKILAKAEIFGVANLNARF